MCRRIIIVNNPAARKHSSARISNAISVLKRHGFDAELLLTNKRGHATELASKALQNKPYCVVAAGGDGTINEVINAMIGSEIPLGILPMGTSNVLARELSISHKPAEAMKRIIFGQPSSIYPGKIEAVSSDGSSVNRHFILMAGIGFDAEAVLKADEGIKRFSGEGAYVLSGIKTLINYSPNELKIAANGNIFNGYAAIIGKASRYGGDFKVTPDANIHEPTFYVCIFGGKGRYDLLRYVTGIILGRHLRQKDVTYLKATEIVVTGMANIQIDGDHVGVTPARITISRDALKIF